MTKTLSTTQQSAGHRCRTCSKSICLTRFRASHIDRQLVQWTGITKAIFRALPPDQPTQDIGRHLAHRGHMIERVCGYPARTCRKTCQKVVEGCGRIGGEWEIGLVGQQGGMWVWRGRGGREMGMMRRGSQIRQTPTAREPRLGNESWCSIVFQAQIRLCDWLDRWLG